MFKEDAVARDNATFWVSREPSGSSREATPIGAARSAMSWGTT